MVAAVIFSIFFALGDASVLFLSMPQFGALPKGERLERIKQSPNYNGKKFVNEVPTVAMSKKKGVLKSWSDFLFNKSANVVPDSALSIIRMDLNSLPKDKDWLVWFGHSSYLMNLSGKKILVDPVFLQSSPVPFINKPFKGTDVIKPSDMPDIDYLVISHDHWDHLDYKTVRELEPRIGKVVCALGVGAHFEYWGFPKEKLVEMDWWESSTLGDGFEVTTTPARHFSGRELKPNKSLWASYVIKSPKRMVWIGGDSGYGPHFAKIGEKFPGIDLAILENGQYSTDWPDVHTLPEYLGREMKELGAARYLTVHHSKFRLSSHDYLEPLKNAQNAAKESGKPVLMPQMGEVLHLE